MKKILLMVVGIVLTVPFFVSAQTATLTDQFVQSSDSCVNLTYNMGYRSRDTQTGGQVSELQDFLSANGYLSSEPTGYFGLLTVSAVKKFQSAVLGTGSATPGYGGVGPLTRAKVNAMSCDIVGTTNTANLQSGCTSTSGYSSTTGQLCNVSTSTPIYPSGCTSTTGYSSTTGASCSTGLTTPTTTPTYLSGCTSNTGWSSTTGKACDGSNTTNPAYIAGCTSTTGYSSTTGASCSTGLTTPTTTPLPTVAMPSIKITNVQYSPTSPRVNDLITTIVTITNDSSVNQITPFRVNVQGTTATILTLSAHSTVTATVPNAFSVGSPGTHTLNTAIIDSNGNTGHVFTNTLTFTGLTTTAPTVEFIGTPTLTLQYDSAGKESTLLGNIAFKITAGSADVMFSADINHPSRPYVMLFDGCCGGAWNMGGLSLIPAGTTATYVGTLTAPTKSMFAGSYKISPSVLGYFVNGAWQNLPTSSFINARSSNSVTIVGETSPYISNVYSDPSSITNGYAIEGVRFHSTSNQVIMNGVSRTLPSESTYTTSGNAMPNTLIRIKPSDFGIVTSGIYPIQVSTSEGASNKVNVNVIVPTTTTVAPTIEVIGTPTLALQYDSARKESALVANYNVRITAGTQAFSFPPHYVTCGGGSPVAINIVGPSENYEAPMSACANGPATIQSGTSATYTIKLTANPNQIFAGSYTATLWPKLASLDPTTGQWIQLPVPILVGVLKTNTVTVVGERAPYISSVYTVNDNTTGAIVGSGILGVRFNSSANQVTMNGVTKQLPSTVSMDGPAIIIKLSDFNITASGTYPVVVSTAEGASNTFYANITVPTPTTAPTVTLTANPTSITFGQSSELSWSSTNATSCTSSGDGASWGWPSTRYTSGGQYTPALTATQTYTMSCTGAGGTTSKSVTVTVATTTPSSSLTITTTTQPANGLAFQGASRVPFTKFTLTAGSTDVVVGGIGVQRTGVSVDSVFTGVSLLDENSTQLGATVALDATHGATIGGSFTVRAGTSMTYTVAGNMAANLVANSGQVVSLPVIKIITSATVTGAFPVIGASHTINSSLAIGNLFVSQSATPPAQTIVAGSTDVAFANFQFTAGPVEDVRFSSITLTESGSGAITSLSACRLFDLYNHPLNNGMNTVNPTGATSTFNLDNAFIIAKGGMKQLTLRCNVASSATGTFAWNITATQIASIITTGMTYGSNITPTGNTTVGPVMTVIGSTPSITITSPNGGESLTVGQTKRITWNSSSIDSVTIAYIVGSNFNPNGGFTGLIANNIPNIGYYDWNVNIPVGTQVKVRIFGNTLNSNGGTSSIIDDSNSFFTVVSPVVVNTRSQSSNQFAGVIGAFSQASAQVAPTPVSVWTYSWTRNLEVGSLYEDDVIALQTALTKEGVYAGEVTGGFYAQTYLAVKAFQAKYGIESTGFVGPTTRTKLNELY